MLKLFKGFCYLIYKIAKKYALDKHIESCKRNAEIHDGTILSQTSRILNNRKKENISIGDKTILNGQLVTFKHGGEITIGDYCFIGENSRIWSAKKITIGNRVLIAHNVNIHDQISHPLDSVERHKDQMHILEKGFQNPHFIHEKEIIIEDDVWIGFNATILKGVKIGKGAIIGACTIVTENVPEFAVVVGNPAKIIKYTT